MANPLPKRPSRRDVFKVAAGAALFSGAFGKPRVAGAQTAQGPDLIFRGGTVVTVDDALPTADAVAVAGGRILAVGTEAEIMDLATDATRIVDLDGATLLPSFIDAHGHFINAPQIVGWANVSAPPVGPANTISDVVDALVAHAARLDIAEGDWVIGYGYDAAVMTDGREMTRFDIDAALPDHKVMVIHVSNHGCVLNSRAFEHFGIGDDVPTPDGGLIARVEGSNQPAGLLMETAFLPLFSAMPQPSVEELLNTLDSAQEIYTSKGVTTAQDGASHASDLALFMRAADEGRLKIDLISLPAVTDVPQLVAEYAPDFRGGPMELPDTAALAFGTYRNRLKLQGVKMFIDGSPQGKTAFWTEPLLTGGPDGEEDYVGFPLFPPEVVFPVFAEFVSKGIQTFTHANGDAAIDMTIEALSAAGVRAADGRRDVVIHSQFMRPDQLDSYVELGISPSFFTGHTYFWGDLHRENTGPERAAFISPMKSAGARGIRFSNHTDFSVTPMDPFFMMQTAILRRSRTGVIIGPDERVDAMTALKAITIDAAWQIFEEDLKGSITPGKLADLVIVDRNPLATDPEALTETVVIETFKEGQSVWRAA